MRIYSLSLLPLTVIAIKQQASRHSIVMVDRIFNQAGAGRYGDSLRAGWRKILHCMTRIYSLGLLPPTVIAMESNTSAAAL